MLHLPDYHFNYSITGPRDQPVILFLHGFLGNCQDFNQIMSSLSDKFCCLAVDLPGQVATQVLGGDDCYSMPNIAKGLMQFLQALNIDKCFLAGYSMGGRLALYLTLHYPAKFAKVILESTSPGLKTEAERLQRIQFDYNLAKQLEKGNFKNFIINWYNLPLFQSLRDYVNLEELIEERLKNDPFELAKSLRYMGTGTQPSLWEKLPQNQIPLLLLVGEYDDKFKQINAEMSSLCPAAQLQIIPQFGHNIHLENPDEYINQLINFCL